MVTTLVDYSFLGKQWALFPPATDDGGMNLVSGVAAVASRIVHFLLMRPGEDPLLPDMGTAPNLFDPQNTQLEYIFLYQLDQDLTYWNTKARMGLSTWRLTMSPPDLSGTRKVYVTFRVPSDPYDHVLTFGYWEYLGFSNVGDAIAFKDSVSLDTNPFFGI